MTKALAIASAATPKGASILEAYVRKAGAASSNYTDDDGIIIPEKAAMCWAWTGILELLDTAERYKRMANIAEQGADGKILNFLIGRPEDGDYAAQLLEKAEECIRAAAARTVTLSDRSSEIWPVAAWLMKNATTEHCDDLFEDADMPEWAQSGYIYNPAR